MPPPEKVLDLSATVSAPPVSPPSSVKTDQQKQLTQSLAGSIIPAAFLIFIPGMLPSENLDLNHQLCLALIMLFLFLAVLTNGYLIVSTSATAPPDDKILGFYPTLWINQVNCGAIFLLFQIFLFLKMSWASIRPSFLMFVGFLVGLGVPPILHFYRPDFFRLCSERLGAWFNVRIWFKRDSSVV